MGIFDDIANAFNPDTNGLNNSISHTGDVLNKTFNPNENNVASGFQTLGPSVTHLFKDQIGGSFSKNGIFDNLIIKPADNTVFKPAGYFFNNTLPKETNNFFNNTLPQGANNFFNNTLPKETHNFMNTIQHSGVFQSETIPSKGLSVTQPMTKNNNDKSPIKNDYTVPLILGSVVIVFLMLQKK